MATHPHVLFLSKVETTSPDSCWRWRGLKNRLGYGVFQWSRKRTGAHRYSWSFFNQQAIPKGKMVLHSCHHPDCVNPLHLRVGDHFDNMSDRKLIGNYTRGEKHFRAVITNDDARAIFNDPRTCRIVAEDYGVNRDVVQRIRTGETYAEATGGGRSKFQRGRGSDRFLTFNGRTLTIPEWGRELGLKYETIYYRLWKKWPIEKVLGPKLR